jgi:glycosyltransferase involved in cell wall biosynthesis
MIPELLATVPYWPDNTIALFQSRSPNSNFMSQFGHLMFRDRVVLLDSPLPQADLLELVRSSTACFALYRPVNENLKLIGLSSGKLVMSLLCGTPVIVSEDPSFQFIEDEGLGKMISHPAEIPAAIETLIANQAAYRNRCKEYAISRLSFHKYWQDFAEMMKRRSMPL